MSKDLVERLRGWGTAPSFIREHPAGLLMAEAADEIERLRAALGCWAPVGSGDPVPGAVNHPGPVAGVGCDNEFGPGRHCPSFGAGASCARCGVPAGAVVSDPDAVI